MSNDLDSETSEDEEEEEIGGGSSDDRQSLSWYEVVVPRFFDRVQCFLLADSPIRGIGGRACWADIFTAKSIFRIVTWTIMIGHRRTCKSNHPRTYLL